MHLTPSGRKTERKAQLALAVEPHTGAVGQCDTAVAAARSGHHHHRGMRAGKRFAGKSDLGRVHIIGAAAVVSERNVAGNVHVRDYGHLSVDTVLRQRQQHDDGNTCSDGSGYEQSRPTGACAGEPAQLTPFGINVGRSGFTACKSGTDDVLFVGFGQQIVKPGVVHIIIVNIHFSSGF